VDVVKRRAGTLFEIDISSESKTPLHRQLYLQTKAAILAGTLRPGIRLPSTRALAQDLQVSRTTVLNAFDQLASEGYLDAEIGSGTRVSAGVPRDLHQLRAVPTRPRREVRVSHRAQSSGIAADFSFLPPSPRPLRPGQPDLNLFPLDIWARLAAKHWRHASRDPEHIDSLGYRPLRRAICDFVGKIRGVTCEPDQVLIVAGAQQALYLCAHTLLNAGEPVWMEDPGYPRARLPLMVRLPVWSAWMISRTSRR
jgi:GntR family transcriptional regulator/MocR family aminotransferase